MNPADYITDVPQGMIKSPRLRVVVHDDIPPFVR